MGAWHTRSVVALFLVLCLSDRNVILSVLPVLPVLWMMVQACNIIHPFFALPIAPVYALPAIPSCRSFCPPLELYALLAVELYALLVEVFALLGKFLPSLLFSRA
jgi:hypothetical protein